jgi:hypothetical protein
MDLPTLGANPKRSQTESETQRAKNLAAQHGPGGPSTSIGRTIREAWADCPQTPGGPSAWPRRTIRVAAMDCPKITPEPLVLYPQ